MSTESKNSGMHAHGGSGHDAGHSDGDHHDGCSHGPGGMHVHGATEGPMLYVSLGITLAFVLGEAIAGVASHSLALLSDSGHNFSDAFALGLAAYAIQV